jgi:hypothetical protein
VTRRLFVAKYASNFGPYTVNVMSDVNSVEWQWTYQLDPTCNAIVTQDPTAGVTIPILKFVGQTTVLGTGSVLSVTPATSTSPALLAPSAGSFTAGDVIRFTSGARAGKITSIGSSAGAFNPIGIGGNPAPGDTFQFISLPKFPTQIDNAGGQQDGRIDAFTLDFNSAQQWEFAGGPFFIFDSIVRTYIAPGLNGRVRYTNTLVLPNVALGYFTIQRGPLQTLFCQIVNTIVQPHSEKGRLQDLSVWIGSAVRAGNDCVQVESFAPFTLISLLSSQFYNWPSIIPADPALGGSAVQGAAVIAQRGSRVYMDDTLGMPVGGSSSIPGTVGVRISENATLHIKNGTPTLKGTPANPGDTTEIEFDDGCKSILTVDCATGAVSPSAVSLTTWTGPGGWDDPATINSNAMSLRNGTAILRDK